MPRRRALTEPKRNARTLAPSRGGAQVRRPRIDGHTVVRRHRGGGPGGDAADAIAGRDVLRHADAGPGPQQDHAAAPHRWPRCRLAPQVPGRPIKPVARITTQRESQVLYGIEGAPFAEFSNDHVRAWSATATDSPDAEPVVQEWREWELELDESRGASDTELLSRLSNRLLDAGGEPAGHASKLARVLGTTVPTNGTKPPEDPVQRAVAEQVGELVEWDRAVRADVYDSVHQMGVTTRKIRSLLKDSQAGLSDDTHAWVLDELRELAAILGVARDAEVLAERYEKALEELPDELVRWPVWERLVEGAKKHYKSGL